MAPMKKARIGQGTDVTPGVAVNSIIDDAGEHQRGEDILPITTSPGWTIPTQGAPVPTPEEGATNPPLDIPVPPPAPASGPGVSDGDFRGAIRMLALIVASQA